MQSKRPFASRVTYCVTVQGSDGLPLPYFPAFTTDEHPFYVREGKVRGEVTNARVLLQSASAFQKGGGKERLAALRSLAHICEQGRRAPHLRLPNTAAYVVVQAHGVPSSGLVWGRWQVEPLPYHAETLALPEDWEPSQQLEDWIAAQGKDPYTGVFEKVRDYALQPWRVDFMWPHADWFYEWQYSDETKSKIVPECLYLRWREKPPFDAGSLELDVFNIALAGQWLRRVEGTEKMPDGLVLHNCGTEIEYVNARLIQRQVVPGRTRKK